MRKMTSLTFAPASLLLLSCISIFAHGDDAPEHFSIVGLELSQIITIVVLFMSLTIYVAGVTRLWRSAGRGRGISMNASAAFALGWTSLFIALIGPFHELSDALFSAHMTQHEILMLVAAPLIILGRPQIAAAWAVPQNWKKYLIGVTNDETIARGWRFVSGGFVALLIHAAALWIWHIPALFDATLESDVVHALQHASFFGTALLFWWAILNSSLDWKSSFVGVLYLFITSLHSGILGALLTFTHRDLYPVYSSTTAAWGLTPLEDQQLGGLIMWVPASLVYIGAGLVMFARLLSASEKQAVRNERVMFSHSAVSNI